MPCDYSRYPPNWRKLRAEILARAKNRCERCGVSNHAVGYRDELGMFVPLCGNGPCDCAGNGKQWPSLERLTYAEACEFRDANNEMGDGNRYLVIVLTVAHLDHDVSNNAPENLAALCQRCHLRHDIAQHRANASATRALRPAQPALPLEG